MKGFYRFLHANSTEIVKLVVVEETINHRITRSIIASNLNTAAYHRTLSDLIKDF